jgi:hypothetical protein
MKHGAQLRPRSALLLVLALSVGCSLLGDRREPERPKAKIESLFVEPDHRLATCLHGDLALSYISDPDSVLFFDKDSRIKVSPPTKKGAARYHAHVLHRVGTSEVLDFTFNQDSEGLIDIDLGRFDQPEEVVITSAARRITEDRPAAQDASAVLDRPDELITPSYVLSFRLVPRDGQIETILPLNRHRYEIETELGTLYLMVSSFSKRDQLLTLIDPQRSLGPLLGEDPYVYLQGEDGAVPPRIMVEVLRPGSKVPWQKAATYHIPEAADRFTKPGDRPFVLRTSKRNLIAFAAAPRLDLELPKEPAQTTALVSASFRGLGEKDALKFVLASAYPTGRKGDYSTKVDSHIITASTGKDTYTCDLSHLDPSRFPLVASLVNRLVTPWKLTAGRWAPEPPREKVSVPLVAPAAGGVKFSRFLSPKYASHFDFLAFLGAGSGKRKGSSLMDPDFGGQPDDPNLAPPPPGGGPTGPGGGGVPKPTPLPTAQPSAGGAFAGGGGDDSQCGCGKNGQKCKNTAAPCTGNCGHGCPSNGCCDPGDTIDGGQFLVTFPCPPKGKTCGKNEQDCKCTPHQWDRESIAAAVEAAIQANKFLKDRYADLDPPEKPVGFAPCHKRFFASDVVAHFWKNAGMGIGGPPLGQWRVTYHVYVLFSPCIQKPEPGDLGIIEPISPNTILDDPNPAKGGGTFAVNRPGGTGSPLTGATFTIDFADPTNPISTSRTPALDPNTNVDVAQAANALGGGRGTDGAGGLTNVVIAGILRTDIDTLNGIRSAGVARSNETSAAWLTRPVTVLDGPDSWTLSLPPVDWAVYQQQVQQTQSGGGGSSSSTTSPTTPPTTTTTTRPSSATKPGPRS